jgi:putative ABC transport system substrate-binding protein
MKQKYLAKTLIFFSFLILSIFVTNKIPPINGRKIYIGIIEITPHPSLELIKKGFIKHAKKKFEKDIVIEILSINETSESIEELSKKLKNNSKFDIFLSLATPATQAICNIEKNKPIVAAAITSPKESGIIKSDNICILCDMINLNSEVNKIKKIIPKLNNIAIIYNSNEINSIFMKNELKKEFISCGIKTIETSISNPKKIKYYINKSCKISDAILCTSSNFLAKHLREIGILALKNKKPLFTTFSSNPDNNAFILSSQSIDYFYLGKKAAELVFRIIEEKESPKTIGIIQAQNEKTTINSHIAKHLNIFIPKKLV